MIYRYCHSRRIFAGIQRLSHTEGVSFRAPTRNPASFFIHKDAQDILDIFLSAASAFIGFHLRFGNKKDTKILKNKKILFCAFCHLKHRMTLKRTEGTEKDSLVMMVIMVIIYWLYCYFCN